MKRPKCKFTYRKKRKNSIYRGVYGNSKGWFSLITNRGIREKYGPFMTEMQAVEKYDSKAVEYFGENARTNANYDVGKTEIKNMRDRVKIYRFKKNCKNSKNSKNNKNQYINKRVKFSIVTRNKVCAKQKWRCNYCNNLLSDIFIVDHIVPLFLGGTNEEYNLQALCPSCDRFKTSYIDHKILSPLSKEKKLNIKDVLEAQMENYHRMMCIDPGQKYSDNINNGTINCHQYIANNITNRDELDDPKSLEMEIRGVKFKIKF